MLYIRENLGSLEKAKEYNQKIYDWRVEALNKNYHPGCVGARACENCFHVISDSMCLCAGFPLICPQCGNKTEPFESQYVPAFDFTNLIVGGYNDKEDYSI